MSDDDMGRRRALQTIGGIGTLSFGIGSAAAQGSESSDTRRVENIVPVPVETEVTGAGYEITDETAIYVGDTSATGVGKYLADFLRTPTGYELPIVEQPPRGAAGGISLRLTGASDEVGEEGYRLQVNPSGVTIRANAPAGLFAGVQTLRQLLPPAVEADSARAADWTVPGVQIRDYPRFAHRGAHLDVARHFFEVDDVKQYIDYLAQYKANHLHLHLTDDQGWRIEIESWPKLTEIGGSTEVGGGEGGFYTQDEYREIVEYAQERFVTVVPEVDMPGHTNAALASYAELNCDGEREDLYTGTQVGFSSLCIDKEITYEFVDDVIREVAELTPGPYIHIGGDEAHVITDEEYNYFMERAIDIVRDHGKRPLGWHQILGPDPDADVIPQYWYPGNEAPEVAEAAQKGNEIIASPASHAYLDMKYHEDTELGLDWAGLTSVKEAYDWDPGTFIEGVDESSIMGPETALWSETLETLDDIEFMLFPRFPAIAELGWSPDTKTDDWESFRERLATQGPRWDIQDINYYESSQLPWA
ncbi:beta-N-acetylhexosaminidase [Halopiger aswanensis]|uniref:beta-N-acetylhexosaminidase n=1 Tax=Halopiger aswanensis TaxID=148449 RepID=A0A419VW48_9EURY|nr:beta-N-acetylhexosaminidase [Halopiger aswanensis]RKD86296.1 hexosaminidase [Halopiger aswanensis]